MNLIKTVLAATLALACSLAFAAVDANKANQAELETVKGVGPAMSGKILEARKSGAFRDWPDMVGRVKGIGDGNARKMSGDGLTVNGSTYVGGVTVASRGAAAAGVRKTDAAAPAGAKAAAPTGTAAKAKEPVRK
ncbi:MAG: helix-hairpin-helix domain-containing protein [Burkholderiaceae bacterium]